MTCTVSPSVSISATSTPSSEVPLMRPIARDIAMKAPVPFPDRPVKSLADPRLGS
jgi:hypothetical protein